MENTRLSPLLVDTPVPGVTLLTFNRPSTLNALTRELVTDFNAALDEIGRDPTCRVVVITGAGRGFCSGQDMKAAEERNRSGGSGVVEKMAWQEHFAAMARRIRAIPQPVIAAVNGAAVGAGMGIALAADIRISTSSGRFLIAAVRIGLSAGECGISYHLPRLIGTSRAVSYLLTGRPIEANEAEQIGLVTRIVTPDELLPCAIEEARAIMENSPFSVAQTKRIMWQTLDAPNLESALEIENRTQILATMTEDYKEATRAFAERRPPSYTGR
jgi:enoyl-CoA hydratase